MRIEAVLTNGTRWEVEVGSAERMQYIHPQSDIALPARPYASSSEFNWFVYAGHIAAYLPVEEEASSSDESTTPRPRCAHAHPEFPSMQCDYNAGHEGDHCHTSSADGRSVWWS